LNNSTLLYEGSLKAHAMFGSQTKKA